MEKPKSGKPEGKTAAFSLIKDELDNFQHQRQRQRLALATEAGAGAGNSSCAETCAANILIGKNAEKTKEEEKREEAEPSTSRAKLESDHTDKSVLQVHADTESNTSSSPEQKAMSNSVVVRQILSYLEARSLLEFRLVSRLWKEEATVQLLSERHGPFFTVKFGLSSSFKSEKFWHDSVSTLSQFMDTCMKTSRNFPCSNFSFVDGELNKPELVTFFSEYGGCVQHLTLKPDFVSMRMLEKIVFKWTRNSLKSLIFQPKSWEAEIGSLLESYEQENSSESEPEPEAETAPGPEPGPGPGPLKGQPQPRPRLLPNLRKLVLSATPQLETDTQPEGRLIYEILTSAPNLTSIEDPGLAFIPQIVSAEKIPLVTSVTINLFKSGVSEERFLDFVAAGPKLTSVTFEVPDGPLRLNRNPIPNPRVISALQTLFTLGQNTLTKIEGIQALGQIQISGPAAQLPLQLQLPPLHKVTDLKVNLSRPGRSQRILPEGNRLSQFLPNLESLDLEFGKLCNSNYPLISPKNTHRSVKRVKISSPSSEDVGNWLRFEWLQRIKDLYPNVTHFHLVLYKGNCSVYLHSFLQIIKERYQQLENLVLELWIEDEDDQDDIRGDFKRDMDKALTGLSLDQCEKLWGRGVNDPEFMKLAAEISDNLESRTNSSILQLTKLTSLTFEVHFEGQAKPLWTQVSQVFAFQSMAKRQGLEVKVRGSQKKNVQLARNDLGPL